MSDESKNEGQGAVRVDLDVISTGGKHLKRPEFQTPLAFYYIYRMYGTARW